MTLLIEYMIAMAMFFFLIPKIVIKRILFEAIFSSDEWADMIFFRYHNLISFLLAQAAFIFFVLTLRKGSYRY